VIAAACTQDTTTGPPVAAEVGIEALANAPGSEGGKITLVAARLFEGDCVVKVAFTGLYQDSDAGTNDGYFLLLTDENVPIGRYQSQPLMVPTKRGTYRGTFDNRIGSGWSNSTVLRLGYWNGAGYGGFTRVADLANGVITQVYPNFQIVDRCH